MIKALSLAFLMALAAIPGAHAQQARIVAACGALAPFGSQAAGGQAFVTMDVNGNLCTNASGSGGGGGVATQGARDATAQPWWQQIYLDATHPISNSFPFPTSLIQVQAGAYPLGAMADGAIVSLGKLTDTTPCATPTSASCSLAQVERAILSSSLSPLAAQSAHGVNTGATEGLTASGVATAGAVENPLLDGGRAATTEPTAVADGQKVSLLLTKSGKLVSYPFQIPELLWRGAVSIASTTSPVTVPNSTSGTLKTYTTSIECYREDTATTGTHVTLNDSSSHIVALPNNGGGGGDGSPLGIPLVGTAINTALQVTPATSITPAWCSATGYFAP